MRLRRIALGVGALALVGCVAAGALAWRPAIAPIASQGRFEPALIAKGAQLAAIGDCAVCHAGRDGQSYAGGNPLETPFGQVYASNITPDADTGIGTWSEVAFHRAMRDGVDRIGNFLYPAFRTTTTRMSTTPMWRRSMPSS